MTSSDWLLVFCLSFCAINYLLLLRLEKLEDKIKDLKHKVNWIDLNVSGINQQLTQDKVTKDLQ